MLAFPGKDAVVAGGCRGEPSLLCGLKARESLPGRLAGGGIAAYVMQMAIALGHCFKAKGVAPHGIVGLPIKAGASVLGWKIAAADAA